MMYLSTRDTQQRLTFSRAVLEGLAANGGLFVPEEFPKLDHRAFAPDLSLSEFAFQVLRPFVANDPIATDLKSICHEAFNFPVPLKILKNNTAVLELFHGPTCAFKDVGARFLASCLTRMQRGGIAPQHVSVIVATSGDTGGAVAGAFYQRPGVDVVILFPKGRISARQEKQLTAWGGNIKALAVRGSFDDCQRLVKDILGDPKVRAQRQFVSANSISLGRLLPQMVYHARAAVEYKAQHGQDPTILIPTGNLGNAVAAIWAQHLGFPIARVGLITNANQAIGRFFETGKYQPAPTVTTLANAMDVGAPSNMERLLQLYPSMEELKPRVLTMSVSDEQIKDTIAAGVERWGEVWCPHTATAVFAREQLPGDHYIICATAHPAKFETIVEPLIHRSLPVPPDLQRLLDLPATMQEIDSNVETLRKILLTN